MFCHDGFCPLVILVIADDEFDLVLGGQVLSALKASKAKSKSESDVVNEVFEQALAVALGRELRAGLDVSVDVFGQFAGAGGF